MTNDTPALTSDLLQEMDAYADYRLSEVRMRNAVFNYFEDRPGQSYRQESVTNEQVHQWRIDYYNGARPVPFDGAHRSRFMHAMFDLGYSSYVHDTPPFDFNLHVHADDPGLNSWFSTRATAWFNLDGSFYAGKISGPNSRESKTFMASSDVPASHALSAFIIRARKARRDELEDRRFELETVNDSIRRGNWGGTPWSSWEAMKRNHVRPRKLVLNDVVL